MALDPLDMIKTGADLAAPVGHSISDAWQAVLGDRIAAWRVRNAAKLQLAINEELGGLGMKLNQARIPERYAFAWFDEATKQDEPEIQALFATLLARAASGDTDAIDRRHVEIVGRFTPEDSRVFKFIFERAPDRQKIDLFGKTIETSVFDEGGLYQLLATELGHWARRSVEHLVVLGLLETRPVIDHWSLRRLFESAQVSENGQIELRFSTELPVMAEIHMTFLGQSLCRALGMFEKFLHTD